MITVRFRRVPCWSHGIWPDWLVASFDEYHGCGSKLLLPDTDYYLNHNNINGGWQGWHI